MLEKIDAPDVIKIIGVSKFIASDVLLDLAGLSFIAEHTSEKKNGQGNTRNYYSLFEENRVITQDYVEHLFKSDEFLSDKKAIEEFLIKGELSGVKK